MRKRFRVRVGNHSLRVWPVAGGWRFAWHDGARWRYVTRATRADIVDAAEAHLEEAGGFRWSTLTRRRQAFLERVAGLVGDADEAAVVEWLEGRRRSGDLRQAVDRFVEFKVAEAGERTPHLGRMAGVLGRMVERLGGRMVADVTAAELEGWWRDAGAGLSAKRRRDMRSSLVTFWKWAQREGLTGPDPVTPAERLPVVAVGHGERRVLEPAELVALLNAVRPEWRAWVALGAWAGLRPEEIAPASDAKGSKRGLRCEEIDWEFGVVRVAAEVSKTGIPRLVPLCDALRRALAWAGIAPGMTGPVVLRSPAGKAGETLRLGREVFGGQWPRNALRHSFGSYRNALVRSLPQVAEEMGTSVAMLHRHYHNPAPRAAGEVWFGPPINYDSERGLWVLLEDIGPADPSKSGGLSRSA